MKVNAITIIFEDDVSEEYAESVVAACNLFGGVADVAVNVAGIEDTIATTRAKLRYYNELMGALKQVLG